MSENEMVRHDLLTEMLMLQEQNERLHKQRNAAVAEIEQLMQDTKACHICMRHTLEGCETNDKCDPVWVGRV